MKIHRQEGPEKTLHPVSFQSSVKPIRKNKTKYLRDSLTPENKHLGREKTNRCRRAFELNSEKCNDIQRMDSGARQMLIGNMTHIFNIESH